MRKLISVTVFSVLMILLGTIVSTAAEVDKEAPRKDIKINLVVKVSGGDPAKPLRNAEVSVMGVDGTELEDRKHTDNKGEVRFQDLPKGEITIIVIAKGWKTFRVSRAFSKPQEVLPARLQQLD